MKRRSFIKVAGFSLLAGVTACNFFPVFKKRGHEIYDEKYDNNFKGLKSIRYVEVHLADHCNLNCKYCSHFSPIADKNFYDLEEYKRDIARLAQITGSNIRSLRFVGGEPLLNPDIMEYLTLARKLFPKTGIHIVTNALLLKTMSDEFWKCMHDNDVFLHPSFYRVDIDWQPILDKTKKFGVSTELTQDIVNKGKSYSISYFYKLNLDATGSQTNMHKCQECFTGNCLNLYEGKLYACPVIAYVKYLNKNFNYDFRVSKGDYLDIYKTQNIDQILKWSLKDPIPFCRYCGKMSEEPWETSTVHTPDEWVL